LIATCYGGRNHKIAVMFAQGQGSFDDLERDVLNGQKLQGVLTSNEVQEVLETKGWEKEYPLFTAVNAITRGLFPPKDIARYREIASEDVIQNESVSRSQRRLSVLEETVGV
jgi:glycerol-3-phosphate dehydrogenase (NAD+)